MSPVKDRALIGWTRRAVAGLGFLVLFPGFALLHYGSSAGWLPGRGSEVFGTGAALVAGVALVFLALELLRPNQRLDPLILAVGLFLGYLILWSIAHASGPRGLTAIAPSIRQTVETIAIWCAVLFVAINYPRGRGMTWTLTLCAIVLGTLFVHSALSSGSFAGPFVVLTRAAEAGASGGYQSFGRSILVIGIVLAALPRQPASRVIVLSVFCVALAMTGARAATVAGLIALLGNALWVRRSNPFPALVLLGLFGLVLSELVFPLVTETRLGELAHLNTARSWLERMRLNAEAVRRIAASPLFGSFGYHLEPGNGYAHNALSSWTNYGVAGFVAFGGLLIAPFAKAARHVRRPEAGPAWRMAFSASLLALFLSATSESIFHSVFPALAWGLTLRAQRGGGQVDNERRG